MDIHDVRNAFAQPPRMGRTMPSSNGLMSSPQGNPLITFKSRNELCLPGVIAHLLRKDLRD